MSFHKIVEEYWFGLLKKLFLMVGNSGTEHSTIQTIITANCNSSRQDIVVITR